MHKQPSSTTPTNPLKQTTKYPNLTNLKKNIKFTINTLITQNNNNTKPLNKKKTQNNYLNIYNYINK